MKALTVRLSNAFDSMATRFPTWPEMAPGIMDEAVLSESQNSESVLITADKDFGELAFGKGKRRLAFCWYVYGSCLGPAMKASVVSAAIQEHGRELPGAFAVLSPGNIRIRRMLPL